MSKCPGTEALLAIGAAMDWDVAGGMRHLRDCEECRAQLEALRLTHAALTADEPVDPEVIARIEGALTAGARAHDGGERRRRRWAAVVEPLVAGVTALVVLASSGIPIDSIPAALLGFALGAALVACGRALAHRMPPLEATHAGL